MKLVRYGRAGAEKPGLLDEDGTLRDLSRVVRDITPDVLSPAGQKRLRALKTSRLPAVPGRPRPGCPLPRIRKIVCIGLHYTDHAHQVGLPLPIGPGLTTGDEVRAPQALEVWPTVNGESRQRGSTANMIFPVRQLIAYVSRFMSLRAGDILSTGTPAGVAHGMKPPRYLQPGDVVEMGITGLGVQKNRVVSR